MKSYGDEMKRRPKDILGTDQYVKTVFICRQSESTGKIGRRLAKKKFKFSMTYTIYSFIVSNKQVTAFQRQRPAGSQII
jgi:hypothetical protein